LIGHHLTAAPLQKKPKEVKRCVAGPKKNKTAGLPWLEKVRPISDYMCVTKDSLTAIELFVKIAGLP
jgi:hypothetical protein